jgi:hypothetical protein
MMPKPSDLKQLQNTMTPKARQPSDTNDFIKVQQVIFKRNKINNSRMNFYIFKIKNT